MIHISADLDKKHNNVFSTVSAIQQKLNVAGGVHKISGKKLLSTCSNNQCNPPCIMISLVVSQPHLIWKLSSNGIMDFMIFDATKFMEPWALLYII